jgi:hypothetical protein
MEQIPSSEANTYSTDQEIPRHFQNPKVHYGVHKTFLSMSQMNLGQYPALFL